jgi:hypothetical protein
VDPARCSRDPDRHGTVLAPLADNFALFRSLTVLRGQVEWLRSHPVDDSSARQLGGASSSRRRGVAALALAAAATAAAVAWAQRRA